MSTKRVIIGSTQWGIADADYENVAGQVEQAMMKGDIVKLPLLDHDDQPLTVYLNGTTGTTAVVDPNSGPKPTEITN